MSTPRKRRNEIINKTFPVNQVLRQEEQPRSKSYNAELSVTNYTSIITKEINFDGRNADYTSMKQCT